MAQLLVKACVYHEFESQTNARPTYRQDKCLNATAFLIARPASNPFMEYLGRNVKNKIKIN